MNVIIYVIHNLSSKVDMNLRERKFNCITMEEKKLVIGKKERKGENGHIKP